MPYILLTCIGLTWILRYGSILSWPRNFLTKRFATMEDLFSCTLCLGFWAGVAVCLSLFYLDWEPRFIFLPLASAGASWFSDGLLRVIQTIEINLDLYRDAHLRIPKPKDGGN